MAQYPQLGVAAPMDRNPLGRERGKVSSMPPATVRITAPRDQGP